MINSIIIKPTKMCNAACTYCAAARGAFRKWSLDDFKRVYDKLLPHLNGQGTFIWHGGEPMLMGPDFYIGAWEYVSQHTPQMRFGMQSNILAYETEAWRDVLTGIFARSVSTSFDLDPGGRVFRGSYEAYAERFFEKLELMFEDGFPAFVISTYTDESAHLAHKMYDMARDYEARGHLFNLRFNYRYPAGKLAGRKTQITPENYGQMLVELWERWIEDAPAFTLVPHAQLLEKIIDSRVSRCPWTANCGGGMVGIEPSGDIFNCSSFADLEDPDYCFGNIFENAVTELFSSEPAKAMRRRRARLPQECRDCHHHDTCHGGCMRDSLLFGGGLYDKVYYCESWKMILGRMKEDLAAGRADRLLSTNGTAAGAASGHFQKAQANHGSPNASRPAPHMHAGATLPTHAAEVC